MQEFYRYCQSLNRSPLLSLISEIRKICQFLSKGAKSQCRLPEMIFWQDRLKISEQVWEEHKF